MKGAVAYPKLHVPKGEDFLLLSPTAQAHAYRNVDRMFATRAIRRGASVLQLGRGQEISPRYQAGQEVHDVDAYMDRANVAGLLVIRDEKIVLERYSLGLEENVRWSSMSMIKSLTATLVGAALQQGAISSLDDAVSKYIPALRGCAYDAVTIRHLITMSSGVRWNEDYTDRNSDVNRYSKSLGDKIPGGVLALMRSLKAEHPPGSQFNYNTGDTYVLGSLISAATGKTLADYMSEMVWSRLGMEFDAFYTLESEAGQEIGGSAPGSCCGILAASASSCCATASSMARLYFLRTGSNMPDARHSSSMPQPIATARRGTVTVGGSILMVRWLPSALPASRSTSIGQTRSSSSRCLVSRNHPIRPPMASISRASTTPSRMRCSPRAPDVGA